MYIRSTQRLFVQSALEFTRRHSAQLINLQRNISTGIRIHRPSDDPAAIRSIVTQQFVEQQFETHLKNIAVARSHLDASVSQLVAVKDLFLEARDIAFESRQTDERAVFVAQVDRLLDRLQQLANDRFDGQFVYSGTATNTQPFRFGSTDPRGRGSYLGANERSEIAIGIQLTAEVAYSGREVFQPQQRKVSLFLGNTGATTGLGTDSAVGFGELTVRHVSTTYDGTSGIAPGASSAAGDTIIGPAGAHSLVIDAVARTISLDGGPSVTYLGTETDLQITGPTGESVFVDVTAVAAGFVGSVDITAEGTLSTDGGASEVPIDFSSNQSVAHSGNGEVTFVNSTAIRQAGIAHVEYQGTADAFGVLTELRRDLLNERNLSESAWQEALSRRLADIDRIKEHVLDVVGQQSATLANLDSLQFHHEDLQLETRRILSDLQSTDLTEAIAELQLRQSLLETTYATTVAMFSTSLLEFLR